MLRIPNPGSNIATFIRSYVEVFDALHQRLSFDLDDISRVLVERNLATSSGYMGLEALARSTREDRSRDPVYNQSKMYSELYKVLGWIRPSAAKALVFSFTYLGAHVAKARRDPVPIFRESVLGMAYPNAVLAVKGDLKLRPFATILRTAQALDGYISRDEMIAGPLSLTNDRDEAGFSHMIEQLRAVREGGIGLDALLAEAAAKGRKEPISAVAMENYTRFPIATLKWLRWAKEERVKGIYQRSTKFFVLTDTGNQALEVLASLKDIRAADLDRVKDEIRAAVVRLGFYQMLQRAGFEIDLMQAQLVADEQLAGPALDFVGGPVLFSPFQELSPDYVAGLFPSVAGSDEPEGISLVFSATGDKLGRLPLPSSRVSISNLAAVPEDSDPELVAMFRDAVDRAGSLGVGVDLIAESYRQANQDIFYPFIARLFRALGYNCEHSRQGVNYQRWDALIVDPVHSIPIEIKSPGEEEYMSVKAVRQALENKIVLLARKPFPTDRETTSLVVGFHFPNDRAEVANLLGDIHKAFGVVIGVIDFRSLLRLAALALLEGKKHNPDELRTLYGFIDVPNA